MITLEDLPEAYVRFDSEFRCTFVNQAAQMLLGNNWAKLLGKKLWDVYPENARTPIEEGEAATAGLHCAPRDFASCACERDATDASAMV